MKGPLIAESTVTIDATPAKVWKALTTPGLIKKYLMGANVISDWTEGGTITYSGEYNGKAYLDKGIIKKIEPLKIFQSTYLSSMSGKPDKPENYNLVTYALSEKNRQTVVVLTQDNIQTEKEKQHSSGNWHMVLKKLKEVAEGEVDG
jgi:uncharacterized protein YndB with AHSA1/START domain